MEDFSAFEADVSKGVDADDIPKFIFSLVVHTAAYPGQAVKRLDES